MTGGNAIETWDARAEHGAFIRGRGNRFAGRARSGSSAFLVSSTPPSTLTSWKDRRVCRKALANFLPDPTVRRCPHCTWRVWISLSEVFAGAPIRSNPQRTYDPVRLADDPEGAAVPSLLAGVQVSHPDRWNRLKKKMDEFGRMAGLFDEILVKRIGPNAFEPFQLEVGLPGNPCTDSKRNLIDVGYGVSQLLPLLAHL